LIRSVAFFKTFSSIFQLQVSQRKTATWSIIGLAGLWLSQMVSHAYQLAEAYSQDRALSALRDWTLCIQWCSISTLCLVVLYLLQIPMMRFHFRQLTLFCLLVCFLHAVVFLPLSPISIRCLTERALDWYNVEGFDSMVIAVADGSVPVRSKSLRRFDQFLPEFQPSTLKMFQTNIF